MRYQRRTPGPGGLLVTFVNHSTFLIQSPFDRNRTLWGGFALTLDRHGVPDSSFRVLEPGDTAAIQASVT